MVKPAPTLTPKQIAILRHIARYQISVRPAINQVFFNDNSNGCAQALAALKKYKLIESHKHGVADAADPKSRFTFYNLTTTGTRLIGVTSSRGKPPGPTSIPRSLAILWHCCMRTHQSHRLEAREVRSIFFPEETSHDDVDQKLDGFHCLSPGPKYQVWNTKVPKAALAETVSELKKLASSAREIPQLAEGIALKRYGYLVLVESREVQKQLIAELAKALGSRGVAFHVACAPGSWRVKSGEVGFRGRRSR